MKEGFIVAVAVGIVCLAAGLIIRWWKNMRPAFSGRSFGYEIADSMGISRNVFDMGAEKGGLPGHWFVLAKLKAAGMSLDDASTMFAPIIAAGMTTLASQSWADDRFASVLVSLRNNYPGCDSQHARSLSYERLEIVLSNP